MLEQMSESLQQFPTSPDLGAIVVPVAISQTSTGRDQLLADLGFAFATWMLEKLRKCLKVTRSLLESAPLRTLSTPQPFPGGLGEISDCSLPWLGTTPYHGKSGKQQNWGSKGLLTGWWGLPFPDQGFPCITCLSELHK